MKKIKQIDIAKALNISRVTVTKALLDSPDISIVTKKMVKAEAEKLGYFPNFTGRNLSSKKTFTIGLVVPKIAHSFFAHSIESFYEAAIARSYYIIPTVSFENNKIEERNIKVLLSMGVDGIIIDPSGDVEDCKIYDRILHSGTKLIFYDRYPVDSKYARVVCNNKEAAKNAVSFIISKGIREIVHFTGSQQLNICKDRTEGYIAALDSAGIKLDKKMIVSAGLTEKNGYDSFIEYFIKNGCPRAVFAVNDPMAVGIYKAAATLKLRIPLDLSVVGFGDIEISQLVSPQLTTVHIPIKEMCLETIKRLIAMIENKRVYNDEIFTANLVIRDSV
jgi:DNA-binding LacI/PurR family transcriptional regulator